MLHIFYIRPISIFIALMGESENERRNFFLDRIPCGILKLKIDEDLTILYSNQAIKALFQEPASLQDMVCESEYPELLAEIHSHLTGEAARFELEFKAKIQKKLHLVFLTIELYP